MTVNDHLFGLEIELSRYPGITPDDALNRRLILRKALGQVRERGYDEGYSDALRDESETRILAQRAQEKSEQLAEDDDATD
jgi:hypothetical protein